MLIVCGAGQWELSDQSPVELLRDIFRIVGNPEVILAPLGGGHLDVSSANRTSLTMSALIRLSASPAAEKFW
jgi:hypothetical protein